MRICHHKENLKVTFRARAFRQSELSAVRLPLALRGTNY